MIDMPGHGKTIGIYNSSRRLTMAVAVIIFSFQKKWTSKYSEEEKNA